ncbi:MAG: hypothetical protein Q4E60_02140 [Bacteroidales bacterium]|nr:hypothetical protein [Bacteroidales bacterium]
MNIFLRCFTFLSNRIAKQSWDYFLKEQILTEAKRMELQNLVINCTKPGVTTDKIAKEEVVVSLTTHGYRIYEASLAIESIMQGTVLPNRIILWLDENTKADPIPQGLKNHQTRGLEIRYTRDIKAYTKLLPAIKAFPEATIVTIDDDIFYPADTLELLLRGHAEHPASICSHFVKQLQAKGNKLKSILRLQGVSHTDEKHKYFLEGFASALYPPHCFSNELFNEEVFMKLTPYADDVWYNVLAIKENVPIFYPDYHYRYFPYCDNENGYDISLKQYNNNPKDCKNDQQFAATLKHYNLYDSLLASIKE